MRKKAPDRAIACPSCGEHFYRRRIGEHDVLVPRDRDQPAGHCPFGDRHRNPGRGSSHYSRKSSSISARDCLHDLAASMHVLSLMQRRGHDGVAAEWPASWSVQFAQCCDVCPTSVTKQARESRSAPIWCSACGRPIRTEATSIAGFCWDCLDRGLG